MKNYLFSIAIILLLNTKVTANCHAWYTCNIQSYVTHTVVFTSNATDSLGTVTSYFWDFGDGQTDFTPSPTHVYADTGIYNVCLIIGTSTSCADTNCITLNLVPVPPFVSAFLIPDSTAFPCTTPTPFNFSYWGRVYGFGTIDSALIHIYFGDGLDTLFYHGLSNTVFVGSVTHIYQNPGTYNAHIDITAPNSLVGSGIATPVLITSVCGNISGKIFVDNNSNCIYDAGDVPLSNALLYISSSQNVLGGVNTDPNGDYSFNVPPGPTYEIRAAYNYGFQSHQTILCPSSGLYTVTTFPSSGNDFAVGCLPAFDLEVWMHSFCLRPGDIEDIYTGAFNSRCNSPNGQVQVVLPPDFTPLPDSVNSYVITGNTVTFPITSTNFDWWRKIKVMVSTTAVIGTIECVDITASPVTGDFDPSNNTLTSCYPLHGAIDPNTKTVSPEGTSPDGLIAPGTELTYNINFQNTGDAPANNIFILDTISSALDISSIRVISSSHAMHWSVLSGHIIRFSFDNIQLPDSITNERESHGYVTYQMTPLSNLPDMTVIRNAAAIYFDYNQPVLTNSVINTIDNLLSVQSVSAKPYLMTIYPNPVNQQCVLHFKNDGNREIEISDLSGRIIFRKNISGDNYILNVNNFNEGIYMVRLTDNNYYSEVSRMVIIK